ncbi:MAG: Ig-like domain-containing protein [Corynebacteriales bacterium]|nr:Ig-like domain-containing protein [Mycobacteriales bacterium]
MTALAAVVLSIFGLNAGNASTTPTAPVAPANPIGDLVAAVFRRFQQVFAPYPTNQGGQTVDPATGVVTGSAQFTSPFWLPQWYTVSAPANGTVTVDRNGRYTYTPSPAARAGAVTTDAFTVTANNWFSRSSTTVAVPLARTNTAPVAGDTNLFGFVPNGVVLGAVSATDPNGDTITYTIPATSTRGGTVAALDALGRFAYTPTTQIRHDAAVTNAPASSLFDTFTISASDGRGGVTPIVVSVPVLPFNQAPVGVPTATTLSTPGPNGVVTGTVTATDADGDTLTYTVPTGPTAGGGTVTITPTGAFTYTPTPAAQHNAAAAGGAGDAFTVTGTDGHGGTTTIAVTVPIAAINTAPTATVTVNAAGAGGVVTGQIATTDPDGDTITYTAPAGTTANGGTVTVSATGGFTYTPAAAPTVTGDTFTITVDDGHGSIVPVSVSVPVTPAPINVAPSGSATANSPDANGVVTGQITATDPDNDPLTYTTGGSSTTGGTVTVDNTTGGFTYTPTGAAQHAAAGGGPTTDTFTVNVSDGQGGVTPVLVTVAIAAANTDPSGYNTPGLTAPNGFINGTVNGTDADRDTLTYSTPLTTTALGAAVTVDRTTGYYTYLPSPATRLVIGTVVGADADGDTLAYRVTNDGSTSQGGTVAIDSTTGVFTYTPSADAQKSAAQGGQTRDSFTVHIDDGHGALLIVPVSVTIAPANTAPTATVTTNTPGAGGVVTGQITATDPDGDTLTYTGPVGTTANGGTVTTTTTGGFTYTPSAQARHEASAVTKGPAASDSFTITASDGRGGYTPITVTVLIEPANTPPTATVTVNTPGADGTVTGQVTVTDADGDIPTFNAPGGTTAGGGTVTITTTGAFTYIPAAKPTETGDSFPIYLEDGHGGFVSTYVSVPLTPVPIPINVAPSGSATVNGPDTNGVVTGTITATDPDGDPLTYAGPDGNLSVLGGKVTIDTVSGRFTYTPTKAAQRAAGVGGPTTDTFTVTVSDGQGGTTAVPVVVAVLANLSNTAPTFVSGPTTLRDIAPGFTYATILGLAVRADGSLYVATDDPRNRQPGVTASPEGTLYVSDGTYIYAPMNNSLTPFINVNSDAISFARTHAFREGFIAAIENSASEGGKLALIPLGSLLPKSGSAATFFPIFPRPVGVAVDDNDFVYIAYADGTVDRRWRFNGYQADVRLSVGGTPTGIAFGTNGLLYVSNAAGYVSVVDQSHTVTETIQVGSAVTSITASPDGTLYASRSDNSIFQLIPALTPRIIGTPDPLTGTVVGSVTALDPDGETLSYDSTYYQSYNGTLIVDPTGTFTYTPSDAARTGALNGGATTDSFTIAAYDTSGGVAFTRVTVPIAVPDNPPVIGNVVTTANDDGTVTGTITATDPDGTAVTFTGPTSNTITGGTIVVTADGHFTYTPSQGARDAAAIDDTDLFDKFTLTATDRAGGSTSVSVTVPIVASSQPPSGGGGPSTPPGDNGGGQTTQDPVFSKTYIVSVDKDTGVVVFYGEASNPNKTSLRYYSQAKTGGVDGDGKGTFVYTPSTQARIDAANGVGPLEEIAMISVVDGTNRTATTSIVIPIVPIATDGTRT